MATNDRVLSVGKSTALGELSIDIAETIRGLKAIQREAKKATQALREAVELQRKIDEECAHGRV